jgi:hypothetical protein
VEQELNELREAGFIEFEQKNETIKIRPQESSVSIEARLFSKESELAIFGAFEAE